MAQKFTRELTSQLAKWKGAHVVGTASGRNQAFLRELGVDDPIDYEKTRFEDVAMMWMWCSIHWVATPRTVRGRC